jgi:hypothetical protein
MEIGMAHQLSPDTAMKLTYRSIAYDKNPTATVASSPMILGYRGVPYLKNLGVVQTIQKQVAVTYRGQAYHKYLSKINYTYLTPLLPLAPCLLPIFTRKLILHDYLSLSL